jgi:peroxidase
MRLPFLIPLVILVLASDVLSICSTSQSDYLPDGSCNNLQMVDWGKTSRPFQRGPEGIRPLNATLGLPSSRVVSNVIASLNGQEGPKNGYGINILETLFGQFINHDLQSTRRSPNARLIVLPPGDVLNNVTGTPYIGNGLWAIIFNDTELDTNGEVINSQTSWLDLSTIYGTSESSDIRLRQPDGTLLTSQQYACKFPPPFFTQLPCPVEDRVYFDALPPSILQVPSLGKPDINFPPRPDGTGVMNDADFRVNNNVALTLLHTLYIREHNRWVRYFKDTSPNLTGDELYRLAKKYTIAVYQRHVFEEYMPTIIPNIPQRLSRYPGYDSSVNPDTSYVFDFGAFRYGHSAFETYRVVDRCNSSIRVVPQWYLDNVNPYQDIHKFAFAGTSGPEPFLIPDVLAAARSIENVWYSLIYSEGGKVDELVSDDLRNIGFGFFPGDLFAFDIERGRLASLPDYYTIRKLFFGRYNFGHHSRLNGTVYGAVSGCPANLEGSTDADPIECFLGITSRTSLASKLKQLYGKISRIDTVVGLLSEDILPSYHLPTSIAHIVFDEYNNKRIADRLWYENQPFTAAEKSRIRRRSFSAILTEHFGLDPSFRFRRDSAFLVPRDIPDEC